MKKKSNERYDSTILSRDVCYTNDSHVTGRNGNSIILGTSGCGKTNLIWQNLMRLKNQSAVVVDSKGQLYNMLKDNLLAQGYAVECINLIDPNKSSCGYNPFDYLTDSSENISQINIVKFSQALVPTKLDIREPIWPLGSQCIISMLASYIMEFLPAEDHNIPAFIKLYHAFIQSQGTAIAGTFYDNPDSFSAGKYAEFRATITAEKMVASFYGFINALVNSLSLPELKPIFCNNRTINFKDIAHKKTVLFLVISDNSSHLDGLLNLMYTQMLQTLIADADEQPDGRLKIPVMLYLDDFGNTTIPSFDRIISITRSRDIQITMVLQSLSQLRTAYGTDCSDTIINNLDAIVYMGGHDIKTTELIASLAKKTPETILNMSNQKQYVFLAGQKAILTDKLLPYTLSESESDSFELQ